MLRLTPLIAMTWCFGCAHTESSFTTALTSRPAGPAYILRVNVASIDKGGDDNEALQGKMRAWEGRARGQLMKALKERNYTLSELETGAPNELGWSLDFDVRYGNRALRWAVGLGAGKGLVRGWLRVVDAQQQLQHTAVVSRELVMDAYGGDIAVVFGEVLDEILEGIPGEIRRGPGPQPTCRANQQPGWAGASAVEKRELLRRCAAPR